MAKKRMRDIPSSYKCLSIRKAAAVLTFSFYAAFELLAFPSQSAAQSAPSLGVHSPAAGETLPASFLQKKIGIPSELGFIEEFHEGTSGKTVVYIQDAHDSLNAQENIAKMIRHLVERADIPTVFEEGYEGRLPTHEYFGFIDEPAIRERVSYYLMDQLRIGGAEYAHINRNKDFELIGADDSDLHLENVAQYRKAAARSEAIDGSLEEIDKEIRTLVHRLLPKRMKEWMKLKEKMDRRELDLMHYLKRSLEILNVPEEDLNERYSAIPLLINLTVEGKNGARRKNGLAQIDSRSLFRELRQLEKEIEETFLERERDRTIFRIHRQIQLIKRLSSIELSSGEYEILKDSLNTLSTRQMAEFIALAAEKSVVFSSRWEEDIASAVRFYELANARDLALSGKLDAYFSAPDKETAILVFGGFHKDRLKEIFRSKGMSYLIITPRITHFEERHRLLYAERMSAGLDAGSAASLAAKSTRQIGAFRRLALDPAFEPAFRSELETLSQVVRGFAAKPTALEIGLAFKQTARTDSAELPEEAVIRPELRNSEEPLDLENDLYLPARTGGKLQEVLERRKDPSRPPHRILPGPETYRQIEISTELSRKQLSRAHRQLLAGSDDKDFNQITQDAKTRRGLVDTHLKDTLDRLREEGFRPGAGDEALLIGIGTDAESYELRTLLEAAPDLDTVHIITVDLEEMQLDYLAMYLAENPHIKTKIVFHVASIVDIPAFIKREYLNNIKMIYINAVLDTKLHFTQEGAARALNQIASVMKEDSYLIYGRYYNARPWQLPQGREIPLELVYPNLPADALAALYADPAKEWNDDYKAFFEGWYTFVFRQASSEARSELRAEEELSGPLNIEKITLSSGVVLLASELSRIEAGDFREELKELLILLQRNKEFHVYIDQLDRYSLIDHPNKLLRALLADRKVKALHHPDQLRGKAIIIQQSFFDQESGGEEVVNQIKQRVPIDKRIIPLQGKAGAVTAFLTAAESALKKADELKESFEESILNRIAVQRNGRWHVHDSIINTIQTALQNHYVIAISA